MPSLGWKIVAPKSTQMFTNLLELAVYELDDEANRYQAVVWSQKPEARTSDRTSMVRYNRTVVGRYATEEEAKRAAVTAARKMLTDELDYYLPE